MKEIIERKLKELNEQYDIYLKRWDKIEDVFSSENDYITNRLNEIRSKISFCNELLKENEIDYKSAYENSFECNKILSKNYKEKELMIGEAVNFIKEEASYDEDTKTCSDDLRYDKCDLLLRMLGEIE